MGTANRLDRTLRATLCEIERGLFHASYRSIGFGVDSTSMAPNQNNLPIYHLARTASDARDDIERIARAIGFETIVWEDADIFAGTPGRRNHLPVGRPAATR
jgi:hypothetical protein